MSTLKDWAEIAFMTFVALIASVFGLASIVCLIAAPFVAIGAGIAIGLKIIMWVIGWPA